MAEDNTADFLELLPQLKTLVSTPSTISQARAIVTSVPDMCYSLIKIMADLGLLDMEVTSRILAGGVTATQASSNIAGPSQSYSTPPGSRNSNPQVHAPLGASAAILHAPNNNVDVKPPRPTSISTPTFPPTAPEPTPPVAASADPTAAILAALPPEQRDAVLAIIAMTPEQLQVMPPEQRAQFLELRRRFLGTG